MKTSLVITVLNEEKTINKLLESIFSQTKKPDEVIIVDGGSTDNTLSEIRNPKSEIRNQKLKLKTFIKPGNRAVGRNYAIFKAKNEIIAITDAGCVLSKNWLKEITTPLKDSKIDIVAGYYKGMYKNIFEKSLIPYVLVMPAKVNPQTFLPASRSMAFRKSAWRKSGFPEKYSYNEDYVFASQLKKRGIKFYFAKKALVYWIPRENLLKSFLMFYNFARGDAQARIFRPKVLLIFARYLAALILFIGTSYTIYFILVMYILWSIFKNYKFVRHALAFFYLPILQFTSDIAVLLGTVRGYLDENY